MKLKKKYIIKICLSGSIICFFLVKLKMVRMLFKENK